MTASHVCVSVEGLEGHRPALFLAVCLGWPFPDCSDLSPVSLWASMSPNTVLLPLLLGHQLSWTLGRVLSLGAGLWISLILAVLQATLSRLAHHQSSISLPGPGEAPILICFRSACFISPQGLWQVPCVTQRQSLTLYLWSPAMLVTMFELPCYSSEPPGNAFEQGDLPCQNICLDTSCSDRKK